MASPYKKPTETGYYGAEGGLMPLFSCGSSPLAPSFLSGNGSHMALWTSILIHVVALAINMAANIVLLTADHAEGRDILWVFAIISLVAHISAVVGTLVFTGFVRNALSMPIVLTLGTGLFGIGLMYTVKCTYDTAGVLEAAATQNVLYNLSVIFQSFGIASILSNALVSSGKNY